MGAATLKQHIRWNGPLGSYFMSLPDTLQIKEESDQQTVNIGETVQVKQSFKLPTSWPDTMGLQAEGG